MTISNVFNAHLRCDNSSLIHYARRPRDEMHDDDAGSTCCNVEFYTGTTFDLGRPGLVRAFYVDEPVTCVVCAIDYVVWP